MNEYERKASVLPKTLESSEGSNGVPELKLITSGERAGSSLNFLLKKGDIFWTTNQSESLHLALKKSYKSPPATVRAASDILHDYKSFYLGKFTNEFHAYRKTESLERCQQIQYLHSEIEAQPLDWKLNNAISICSQFSVPSAKILTFPEFNVTSELVYTSL